MAKTIILDDETYNALKKEAKAEDRSICKTAKRLIQMGLQAKTMTQTMTQTMAPTAISESKTMTIEEPNEEESKPAKHYAVDDYEKGYEMTDEELYAMNKKFKESRADITGQD